MLEHGLPMTQQFFHEFSASKEVDSYIKAAQKETKMNLRLRQSDMHKASIMGITTDGMPKHVQKLDHHTFGITEMQMNEYFMSFRRHSFAPLKIIKREIQ